MSDRLGRLDLPDGYPEVFGKYVLVRPMARGGMGELFIAAAGETGGFEKLCVVKKVLHSLEDGAVHRRFLDEAKVVVRLNHANLVQVFDAGKVDGEYYLAMELVEGKDLRAVWNRCAQLHRRIPVDIAIFVIREVLRGLHYVHDAMGLDLVHRDISPPNVLVGYRGDVKLTDFGLAKSSIKREMTSPGVVFGRYSYLSPEQAKGLPADRRTDIYACAIVLWELLTGRQLFPSGGRSHTEALEAVRNPKAPAPSSLVPGIPDGLDEVVLRGLARDREDRYQKAGEFRAALSEILAKNFPAADADRVAEFMRDIFSREAKMEQRDYLDLSSHDFSDLRAQGDESELISISDVVASLEKPRSTMELGESDIVELGDRAGGRWDEKRDAASLAEAAEEWVGRVVSQRYRVESLIGVGGMGAVFRVKHLALGKTFALKVLHSHYTRDADVISRFMREARAASQTGHPHIIDVLDVGTNEEGDVYFVMELLEGQNLGETIKREGPLAVRRAVHIARQVCQALSAAHAAGIIHRDLKSENIILTPRGKDPDFVKVLDFGICKQMDGESGTTSPGLIMGSPDYMAPEQGAGLDATIASDIYALGCILFEMLTGRMPFQGRNAVDVLMQKGAREADTVTVYRPEVPQPVASAIGRCLRRQPGDRPPSMRSLEYELTRAIDGRATAVANVLGMEAGGDDRGDDAGASLSMNRAAIATMGDGVYGRDYEKHEFTQVAPAPRNPAQLTGSQPAVPQQAGAPQAAQHGTSDVVDVAPKQGSAVRALFFTALGGALAVGVLAVLMPGGITSLFGGGDDDGKAAPAVAGQPGPGADAPPSSDSGHEPAPAVAPPKLDVAPVEQPKPEPEPEPAAKLDAGTDVIQVDEKPGGDADGQTPAEPPNDPVALVKAAEAALEDRRWADPPETSLAAQLSKLRFVAPEDPAIARLQKDAAEVLLPEGEKALKKKKWADAVVAFRNLRLIWPDHPEAREGLVAALAGQARVLRRLDDHEGALKTADEWLNVDPNAFDALMLRGDMLSLLARHAEAKEAYRAARKKKPRSKAAKEKFFKASYRARKAKG